MSRRSRDKGRAWQAELARRWRERGLYPDAASTQGAQTRSGGGPGHTPPDVEGTPWWCEAKHQRRPSVPAALRQAERERAAAWDHRPALAVVREHGTGPGGAIVAMRLDDFERLVGGEEELTSAVAEYAGREAG